MTAKLLTWPLAFLVASAVMLVASLVALSTAATAVLLAASLVLFVVVAVPVAEGLGPRAARARHRRAR